MLPPPLPLPPPPPSPASGAADADGGPFFVGSPRSAAGAAGFEAVWLRLFESPPDGASEATWLSPVNALLNFGLTHEPRRYELVLLGVNESFPMLGSNRPAELDLRAACCATFAAEFEEEAAAAAVAAGAAGGGPAPPACEARSGSFPEFYKDTAAQLAGLADGERRRMRAAAARVCGGG